MVADDVAFACHERLNWSFDMTIRSHLAVAAIAVACLQAGPLFAQNAAAPDTAATPAPAASPAPAATPTPAPSPDASPASAPPSATKDDKPTGKEAAKSPKRIKVSAETRQQIDHALKSGTVPSRYRKQIPREYQKFIPFER
jgi:hypothetical protein